MLRLVIDTAGLSLEDDPRLVYLGHSASQAQAAIDACESDKLSIIEVVGLRRAKKTPITEPHPAQVPPPPMDGLEEMTIEELKNLSDDEGIEYAGAHLKQDYIDIIRLYKQLDDAHTVDALKDLAVAEEVETKGFSRKAEFINAIVAKRRLHNFP